MNWKKGIKANKKSRLKFLKQFLIFYWITVLIIVFLSFTGSLLDIPLLGTIAIGAQLGITAFASYLVYIDGKHWKIRGFWLWIILIFVLLGVIGYTLYYFNFKNPGKRKKSP